MGATISSSGADTIWRSGRWMSALVLTLPDPHQAGRESIAIFLVARDLVRAVPRGLPDLDLRAAIGLLVARDQEDLLVVDPEDPSRELAILSRQGLLRTYERLAGPLPV